jgi:hypothetical protein
MIITLMGTNNRAIRGGVVGYGARGKDSLFLFAAISRKIGQNRNGKKAVRSIR